MKKIRIFKTWIYTCVTCSLLIIGCNQDEDAIVPSDELPVKYVLPQGNAKYDTLILNFYKESGVMVLYEYQEHDPMWNVQELVSSGLYTIVKPKKEDLEIGVNAFFEHWLALYPPEFFTGRLPRYLYLADSVINSADRLEPGLSTSVSMTFSGINASIGEMTEEQLRTFRANLNVTFWEYILDAGFFEVPEEFDMDFSGIDFSNARDEFGLIHGKYNGGYESGGYLPMTKEVDFKETMKYLFAERTTQRQLDMYLDWYPACKPRVQLYADVMKRKYGIDLEVLTGLKLPHSEE